MDTNTDRLPGRLPEVAAWFAASPAELLGLGVLLLGGIACTALLVWWAPPGGGSSPGSPGAASSTSATPVAAPITVHVTGAVGQPGLVVLAAGSRVADAVAGAGGARPDADLGALNLAREVADGERVAVPSISRPDPPGPDQAAEHDGAVLPDGRIDLNAATAADLEQLPGIGPVLAARIVQHRDEHGPFAAAGDLRAVPGIGEQTFQRLASLIAIR